MKCLKCRTEIDMTTACANAESYGGSRVIVACPNEKCQAGNVVTLEVIVKYTDRELYRGDKDQDDWGNPIKPIEKKKVDKPAKLTYDDLQKMVEDYNDSAKRMLKEGSCNLPVVMRYVAEDMFVRGVTDTELAKTVRQQLKCLHDTGVFDIQR